MDVLNKADRSRLMSHVRSGGNKGTELKLILFFRAHRITGWRRRQSLFGKPDFVFRESRVVVFVDGCFWHGCPLHGRIPKSNRRFWVLKFAANVERDRLVSRTLRVRGWKVIRVWEHELARKSARKLLARLAGVRAGGS